MKGKQVTKKAICLSSFQRLTSRKFFDGQHQESSLHSTANFVFSVTSSILLF
jgi:hypothetical protein